MVTPLTARLFRAGRALAGLTQSDLAKAARVAKQTVSDFERGLRLPYPNNLRAMQAALEAANVEILPDDGRGPGVCLRRPASPEAQAQPLPGVRIGGLGPAPEPRPPSPDASEPQKRPDAAVLAEVEKMLARYALPASLHAELLNSVSRMLTKSTPDKS